MATTSGSTSERESDSKEVFSDLSRSYLEAYLSESLSSYQKLWQKFKILKTVHEETVEECDKLDIDVFELKGNIFVLEKKRITTLKGPDRREIVQNLPPDANQAKW
jgi:hypothetical protein